MLELQLWYVIHVVRSEGADFVETITRRTQIYSLSTATIGSLPAGENPEWIALVEALRSRWRELGDDTFLDSFWSLLESHIVPGIPAELEREKEALRQSDYGFSYEYHPEYFGPEKPDLLTIHFRNFFVPESPFQYRPKLVRGLFQILDRVSGENPDVDRVQCGTWLNNLDLFIDLFPESWRLNMQEVPMDGSFGWWGQFVDRTGQLHKRNVAAFKRAKRFLYPNRVCTCGMEELRQHLECAGGGGG
jgi:hypothetical protein